MTEQELRALVREAVARNVAGTSHVAPRTSRPALRTLHLEDSAHPSHAQYITLINVGDACLIEPSVECTHCGYCKSHGH